MMTPEPWTPQHPASDARRMKAALCSRSAATPITPHPQALRPPHEARPTGVLQVAEEEGSTPARFVVTKASRTVNAIGSLLG